MARGGSPVELMLVRQRQEVAGRRANAPGPTKEKRAPMSQQPIYAAPSRPFTRCAWNDPTIGAGAGNWRRSACCFEAPNGGR